jgi:hypothetical protein
MAAAGEIVAHDLPDEVVADDVVLRGRRCIGRGGNG